jgi:hypothetical protein
MPARLPIRAKTHRGIYLISTLLLLTFLVIVSGSVIVSLSQSLSASGNVANKQLAYQAAMSGLAYVQARLETNASTYSPGALSNDTLSTTDGSMQVADVGNAIQGYLDDSNVGSGKVHLMFRCAFNNDYAGYSPPSGVASGFASTFNTATFRSTTWNLPDFGYLSANNLNRGSSTNSHVYSVATHSSIHSVPGGTADIIVEGLALAPSGNVLARRLVEATFSTSQVGGLLDAASAAKDINLGILQSGGGVTVSSTDPSYGALAALSGNITLSGHDAISGSTPPGYSASSKANLGSSSSQFFYNQTSASNQVLSSKNVTSDQSQVKSVSPPAVPSSNLPAAQSGATQVDGGTWVIWNGSLYHYPTSYQAIDSTTNQPVPLTKQPWSQPDATKPPLYNDVSTDTPTGKDYLDATNKLKLDKTTNTVTVSKDVVISTASGQSSFSLVVAPSVITTSTGFASLSSPTISSSSIGSAQIVFDAASGTPPTLRAAGSIAVIGNMVGQGSVFATSSSGGAASDITVIGRSSLDSRADSGLALYATGSLNLLQMSQAQAPAAVPAVQTEMVANGITPGSGASIVAEGAGGEALRKALYEAIAQSARKDGWLNDTVTGGGTSKDTTVRLPANFWAIGDDLWDNPVQVTYNAQTYGNGYDTKLGDVLAQIAGTPIDKTTIGRLLADSSGPIAIGSDNIPSMMSTGGKAWTNQGLDWENMPCINLSAKTMQSYVDTGDPPVDTSSPSPSASASASGSASPSASATTGSLNQVFNGLVYAGKDVNFTNGLGSISINGGVAAFGADPNNPKSSNGGGSLNLSASSITLKYDPQVLAMFASYFGGQVALKRSSTSNF